MKGSINNPDVLIHVSFISVFKERESLNSNIVHAINQASDDWGIRCLRYEIKDIHVPPRVKESMQMQVRHTASIYYWFDLDHCRQPCSYAIMSLKLRGFMLIIWRLIDKFVA